MVKLSEGSSVKGSPEDKQPSGPYIRGSAKISRRVTLALYTGTIRVNHGYGETTKPVCLFAPWLRNCGFKSSYTHDVPRIFEGCLFNRQMKQSKSLPCHPYKPKGPFTPNESEH